MSERHKSGDVAALRSELEALARASAGEHVPAGAFLGGASAGQLRDNWNAGRVHFGAAHRAALHGLGALDALDELDVAEAALAHGTALLWAALAATMRAGDLAKLRRNADARGRKATTADRNARLAAAVEAQAAAGVHGRKARIAALQSDAELAAECDGMTDSALLKAIQLGRKISRNK